MNLSEEQSKFVEIARKGKNILVDACIGSGKPQQFRHFVKNFREIKRYYI